jgi:predicted CoA-binding protein
MDRLDSVRLLLRESSDPGNPPAEGVVALFERLSRIAVVGLSRDPTKAARRVPSYLAAQGYDLYPVNPHAVRLLGRPATPTLAEVRDPVDLVVVFRPSAEAGAVIQEAVGLEGGPAIWLQEGIRADREAAEARAVGRLVVQDLCTYKVHRALFT